ncbi:Uncharacterised protein [Bordetella pertussis]|nr:Uncharacterised protein [Bordetella pertussis]
MIRHGRLDPQLGQEVDGVFGAAVKLGVAFLASEALHLSDGQALDADVGQGHPHFVQLEGLDDGDDEFHGGSSHGYA